MMKRILVALLCVALLTALCACSAQPAPAPTTAPTTAPTAAPTAQPSPTAQATEAPTEAPTQSPTETPSNPPEAEDVPAVSEAKDGTYTARMSETYAQEKGHGWQTTLTVIFKGGAVESVDFDAFKDGERKSAQSAEAYPMDPLPSEWTPKIADQIQAASVPGDIDGVTGATIATEEAKRLYAAILQAAAKGETAEITLD